LSADEDREVQKVIEYRMKERQEREKKA